MRAAIGRVAGVVGFWAVLVATVALAVHAVLPGDPPMWLLVAVAGPPLYAGVELLAARLLRPGARLRVSSPPLSRKHVMVALLGFLGLALLGFLSTALLFALASML